MEPDFERLPQFSPVLGTTDLTKPVIQVKKEKQGRIITPSVFGQKKWAA